MSDSIAGNAGNADFTNPVLIPLDGEVVQHDGLAGTAKQTQRVQDQVQALHTRGVLYTNGAGTAATVHVSSTQTINAVRLQLDSSHSQIVICDAPANGDPGATPLLFIFVGSADLADTAFSIRQPDGTTLIASTVAGNIAAISTGTALGSLVNVANPHASLILLWTGAQWRIMSSGGAMLPDSGAA